MVPRQVIAAAGIGVIMVGIGAYLNNRSDEQASILRQRASLYQADAAIVAGDVGRAEAYKERGSAMFRGLPVDEIEAVISRPIPADAAARADRIAVDGIFVDVSLSGAANFDNAVILTLGMIGAGLLLPIGVGLQSNWSKKKQDNPPPAQIS